MKRTLLFIASVLASLAMSAQEELVVENLQNSGCLSLTRGNADPVPTIVLQKEGNILSVQLLNYESFCDTEGFVVKNGKSEGSNGVPSLTVGVYPIGEMAADCTCQYNVSFTLRDLEANTFYLKCWWYEGLVTLEEGKPFVLENTISYTTVDGVNYELKKAFGTARIIRVIEQKNKMIIPAELNYEGQTYAVKTISISSFYGCTTIKTMDIPESVNTIDGRSFYGCKFDTLIIRGFLESRYINSDLFYNMGTDMKVFVQPSEVEKYKAIYEGPVYPLTKQTIDDTDDVKINETTFPDSNFREWVLSQEYGADGVLTKEELENVTSLNISRLDIHNQKGLEYFTALKVLNCMTNKLTTLNLSKNTALEKLECNGNRLTTINLLKNNELRRLNCVANNLASLDVSACTELDTLGCSGNQLTTLDVSKNTKMRCLECYSNQLTSLDLSKNTALIRLHCNDNHLTTLDVSKNTALTLLECSDNQLTTLDVPKNSALTYLSCMDNKLTTLCVLDNKSLELIICSGNLLTSLDVSGCSALKSLGCAGNQLITLNLSGCSALEEVNCNSNQLKTLDLSENNSLTTLFCYQNKIKGIGMDALVESLPTVSKGSLNVMYFENEQNVMTTTQVAAAKAKGWTPYIWTYSISNEFVGSETALDDYRPMIEDGKVWKVGDITSGNPAQCVEHFYFDGDTIIGGKTCKRMMRQSYVSPDYISQDNSLSYVGAWYEEGQKVYIYDSTNNQFKLMYDFSIDGNDTIEIDNLTYVIGPRQTGGINGFKGVYRNVRLWVDGESIYSVPWLEGVGGTDRPTTNVYPGYVDPLWALMSCTVGDEVIYLNDTWEDGATPESAEARKRIDFTHTIKTNPKAPMRREAERPEGESAGMEDSEVQPLYGEYNNLQLSINLDPLDEAYQVSITDESGQVVYEKAINAGNIVGLSIDISAYAKGRYTVTVENSRESFTGEFEMQTSGIEENLKIEKLKNVSIYNLQGQRLSSLQKGLNIVDGQKRYMK